MAKTLLTNITGVDLPLPMPYRGILRATRSVVLNGTPDSVITALGGASIANVFSVSPANDNETLSFNDDGAAALASASASKAGLMSAADKARAAGALASTSRLLRFAAPAAKGATDVHLGYAGNNATLAFPGPFTNPVIPRNLRVTFAGAWDGGTVTVTGTDQFDAPVSELFTPGAGTAVVGTKVFKTVTSAVKSLVGASATTASIGSGDTLGILVAVADAFGILLTDDVAEAVTVTPATNSFIPTTVPNGAHNYKLLVNL